jgi:hypothetical protein
LTSADTADASDHEGAAEAIAEGLAEGHSKERPGFWLHTGGTGILTYKDSEADRLGESSDHVYNDWDGVEELTNLPDSAFHRNVDKIVLKAGTEHADTVKTALLCPPTIYGEPYYSNTDIADIRRQGTWTIQFQKSSSIRTGQSGTY